MRAALIIAFCISLSGCTIAKEFVTEPTGRITIERQEFIDTWAIVKVLYKRMYEAQVATCERPLAPDDTLMQRRTCQRLPAVHEEVRALAVRVDAKIEVPESRIDWANVAKLLGALISLVP